MHLKKIYLKMHIRNAHQKNAPNSESQKMQKMHGRPRRKNSRKILGAEMHNFPGKSSKTPPKNFPALRAGKFAKSPSEPTARSQKNALLPKNALRPAAPNQKMQKMRTHLLDPCGQEPVPPHRSWRAKLPPFGGRGWPGRSFCPLLH